MAHFYTSTPLVEREPLSESVEEHREKNKENTKEKNSTPHTVHTNLICLGPACRTRKVLLFKASKNAYVSTEFLFISNMFMRCTLTSGSGAESCMIHTTSER